MQLQKLSDAVAFSPGADLWLLPMPEQSWWSRKVDWYLNFQMARAQKHTAPVLPDGLRKVLADLDLPAPEMGQNPNAPLLIHSAQRLPVRMVVQTPFAGSSKDWLERLGKVWQDLGHPSTRIFLPEGQKLEGLLGWPSIESLGATMTYVQDRDNSSGGKS